MRNTKNGNENVNLRKQKTQQKYIKNIYVSFQCYDEVSGKMFLCNKLETKFPWVLIFDFSRPWTAQEQLKGWWKPKHILKNMSFSGLFVYVLHLLYQKGNFSVNSLRSFRGSNTQCDEKNKKTIAPFFGYYHCKKNQTYFLPL